MAAYLIGLLDITDPEVYKKYSDGAANALKPYGGRFKRLATTAHAAPTVYEGEAPSSYMFIIEFESRALFEEFYGSAAYQDAISFRHQASNVKSIMIMEGD